MLGDDGTLGDYVAWQDIDYQPVVSALPPISLLDYVKPGQRVLEIGCGRGDVALFLAEHGLMVEGIDINPSAIGSAQAKAEAAGLTHLVNFHVGDFLQCDPLPETADAVVLIRVLTCLPEERSWLELIRRVWQCLRPSGVVFIHDFLVTPDTYEARYRAGVERGWRYGTFSVPDQVGATLFVARHHTDADLERIFCACEVVKCDQYDGVSMRGNSCRMFACLARRPMVT